MREYHVSDDDDEEEEDETAVLDDARTVDFVVRIVDSHTKRTILLFTAFVAGAMSGVIASFAATPPDVVKTRTIIGQEQLGRSHKEYARRLVQPLSPSSRRHSLATDALIVATAVAPLRPAFATPVAYTNATSAAFVLETFTDQQDFVNRNNAAETAPRPWTVLQQILEEEGPAVLFSGVSERCLGAIPRFGTTLAMHDFMEQALHQAGWLAQ
jgi:hypothetical protein